MGSSDGGVIITTQVGMGQVVGQKQYDVRFIRALAAGIKRWHKDQTKKDRTKRISGKHKR
jgi:hypothetical protein